MLSKGKIHYLINFFLFLHIVFAATLPSDITTSTKTITAVATNNATTNTTPSADDSVGIRKKPLHPSDISFYEMEKKGKKPNEFFKLQKHDKPNIIVKITEKNDYDNSNEIVTNKSKLIIKWSYNVTDTNNKNTTTTGGAGTASATIPKSMNFTVKLFYNLTQNSVGDDYFYPFYEEVILSNAINITSYEYKIPKLKENYVYNIAVIDQPAPGSKEREIGISPSISYQLYVKQDGTVKSDDSSSGINPTFIIIAVVAVIIIIGAAFVITKKINKKDHINEEKLETNDKYVMAKNGKIITNLKVNDNNDDHQYLQSPDMDKNQSADRLSVFTDDTGEVSWSNLEIANNSQQTKNVYNNDKIIRTLDKTYKREKKDNEPFEMTSPLYKDMAQQIYRVGRIFNPTEEDEIKLNMGDEIEITVMFEDGWCEGKNKSTNEMGIFPRVCIIEEEKYNELLDKSTLSTNSNLPNRRRSKRISMNVNMDYNNTPNNNNNILNFMDDEDLFKSPISPTGRQLDNIPEINIQNI